MSFFKFSPDLMSEQYLNYLTIGRKEIIDNTLKRLSTDVLESNSNLNIIFVGQRGIGKTHILVSLFYKFIKNTKLLPIRLSEEEYSIISLDDFFRRILQELKVEYNDKYPQDEAIRILTNYKKQGKHPILILDNLQMIFEQLSDELPKLRSILQEYQLFSIIGSALSVFSNISKYDEPFYNYFELNYIRGLNGQQVEELIKKRLIDAERNDLIISLPKFKNRIEGIQILTGGNPRLIHSLCEIIIQKSSIKDLEKDILQLLDQLTPFYQARMESLSPGKRKIIDTVALAEGPMSPTELSKKTKIDRNIIITQIRRLEQDGIVESLKFRKKKEIKYQISERLYRIWREMRSPLGLKKINLFVEFIKIWYTNEELHTEYNDMCKQFVTKLKISKFEARKSLDAICYILSASTELMAIDLARNISRLLTVDDLNTAKNEIDTANNTMKNVSDPIIKDVIQIQILVSELMIESYLDDEKGITKKIEEIDRFVTTFFNNSKLEDSEFKLIAHNNFLRVTQYFIQMNKFDLAQKYIDMAHLTAYDHYCIATEKVRIELLVNQDEYLKALELLENLKTKDKTRYYNDEDLLYYTVLSKNYLKIDYDIVDEALSVIEKNIEYFPEILRILHNYNKLDKLKDYLKINRDKIDSLDSHRRDIFILELGDEIFHTVGHLIQDRKENEIEMVLQHLIHIKDLINDDQIIKFMIVNIARFFDSNHHEISHKMIDLLTDTLGASATQSIKPLEVALNYIKTKNTDLLEELHPEYRDLVTKIITKFEPNLKPDIKN